MPGSLLQILGQGVQPDISVVVRLHKEGRTLLGHGVGKEARGFEGQVVVPAAGKYIYLMYAYVFNSCKQAGKQGCMHIHHA